MDTTQSDRSKSKSTNSRKIKLNAGIKLVLGGILVINFMVMVLLIDYARTQNKFADQASRANQLAYQDAKLIKGYACGVFSSELADKFLGQEVEQQLFNLTAPVIENELLGIRHFDRCYYEAEGTSDVYAELYIQTYTDNTSASDSFKYVLPAVSEAKEIKGLLAESDTVLYDSGIYYVLRERQIIQVGASNGNTSDSQEFAKELLFLLEPSL